MNYIYQFNLFLFQCILVIFTIYGNIKIKDYFLAVAYKNR